MDLQSALRNCETSVRRHDPDRYFAALFAPAERRPLLFALYAFNHEIARVAEVVHEPMLGAIRLQWWRETVAAARDLHRRNHDVAHALVEVFASTGPPLELFEAMIDARGFDLGAEAFPDMAALEAYADATSGNLMRLAARVLGAEDALDDHAREAGIAYGLTGILRSIPLHAQRNRVYLPQDLLDARQLGRDAVVAGRGGVKLTAVIGHIAARAGERLASARKLPKPKHAGAALLPAALVPAYLRKLTRPGFDPFREKAEVPLFRRQLSLMRASLRGRI